jgi:hypothetical protein
VTRVWRLAKVRRDCIGAVASDGALVVAGFSFARVGDAHVHHEDSGRTITVQPVIAGSERLRFYTFGSLDDAMAWLEGWKADFLERGWTEVPLEPLNDPD